MAAILVAIQQQGQTTQHHFQQELNQQETQLGERIQGLQQRLAELEWTVAAVASGQPVVHVKGMPIVAD